MIVPEFWAEARIQKRFPNRQITVRRFGWSDDSIEAAERHAQERVRDAFQRIVEGQKLPRRERKVRYNGADGLPIREEILERVGDHVVTRNSYGARCLNTPNVLFADVDFPAPSDWGGLIGCIGFFMAIPLAYFVDQVIGNRLLAGLVFGLPLLLGFAINFFARLSRRMQGGNEAIARKRINQVLANHPDWHVRVYQSPNGFRLLAMNRTFDPRSEEVEQFFNALQVDPTYRLMCQKQNCFRARLTAKPWRIGIEDHLKPRPGVWPVAPEHHQRRNIWVEEYESTARNYAACRFLFAAGPTNRKTTETQTVQEYHDRICNAKSDYELA